MRILKKLNGRRGASLAISLVVLLVCLMAGAAALTAAAANAGRYSHLRQDEQEYLAASSAARLVDELLTTGADGSPVEFKATATLTKTEVWTYSYDGATSTGSWGTPTVTYAFTAPAYESVPPDPPTAKYTGRLSNWLRVDLLRRFYAVALPGDWRSHVPDESKSIITLGEKKYEYTPMTLKVANGAEEMDGLTVNWVMEIPSGSYDMIVTLWVAKTDHPPKYKTQMRIPAKVVPPSITSSVVSDSYSDLEYDEDDGTLKSGKHTVVTEYEVTSTVTWPKDDAVFTQIKTDDPAS